MFLLLSFHFRVSINFNPNNLCDETLSKGISLIDKESRSGVIFNGQMTVSLHFFGFRFILLLVDQFEIWSRSDCNLDGVSILMTSDNDISSTYFQ